MCGKDSDTFCKQFVYTVATYTPSSHTHAIPGGIINPPISSSHLHMAAPYQLVADIDVDDVAELWARYTPFHCARIH